VAKMKDADLGALAEEIKKTAFKITRMGELIGQEVSQPERDPGVGVPGAQIVGGGRDLVAHEPHALRTGRRELQEHPPGAAPDLGDRGGPEPMMLHQLPDDLICGILAEDTGAFFNRDAIQIRC